MNTPEPVDENGLIACPYCRSFPKLTVDENNTWIHCSNVDDPCPSYDTYWTGISPMSIGSNYSKEKAIEAWNEFAKRK